MVTGRRAPITEDPLPMCLPRVSSPLHSRPTFHHMTNGPFGHKQFIRNSLKQTFANDRCRSSRMTEMADKHSLGVPICPAAVRPKLSLGSDLGRAVHQR